MTLLANLFLGPLMDIYSFMLGSLPDAWSEGARLIAFSVLLNLALLPVYTQMEKRSRANRTVKVAVARDVARMKRHFRGRERYFYIRAVYRQYGYHPISELLGSADLAVQIIVFATVYRFLSGLPALVGTSFGPIADLSRPDGLLGGVNLLPFVMTAINAAAVFAYVDERAKRIQALALAGIFLALLYNSAAGLVLYWTTNNLYALCRTLVQRHVLPRFSAQLTRLAQQLQLQR
jgi:membrane protein insertase Oxa1/YidC/SpoIIIJ